MVLMVRISGPHVAIEAGLVTDSLEEIHGKIEKIHEESDRIYRLAIALWIALMIPTLCILVYVLWNLLSLR